MIFRCLRLTASLLGGLLVATTADVAHACWERDAIKPANASFVRDGPTSGTMIYSGYKTFGASSSQFCGCGVAPDGLACGSLDPNSGPGVVDSIDSVTIVEAGTTTPIAGFNFSQNGTTTSDFNAIFTNPDWQGFSGQITNDIPVGTELDLRFALTLNELCDNDAVLDTFSGPNSRIGGDETNVDGSLTMNHLTLVQPLELVLDHFKCYKVVAKGPTPKRNVTLLDQFEFADERVMVPVAICNPVDKNGEGISDPDIHLTCYKLVPRNFSPKLDIVVENQFGEQAMTVVGPRTLCVPSTKEIR